MPHGLPILPTTDCGLRYVHRTLARQKITNLVAGVRQVRETL